MITNFQSYNYLVLSSHSCACHTLSPAARDWHGLTSSDLSIMDRLLLALMAVVDQSLLLVALMALITDM